MNETLIWKENTSFDIQHASSGKFSVTCEINLSGSQI